MSHSPLHGVKVVDLSLLLPGPLCTMYLGDLGAEIIKVENPRAIDGTRVMFQSEKGVPALYLMLNRNKKSITLNLKKEKGKEILFRLLENADILIEGFRPDAMSGMGIGYEELKERFPKLIYCGLYGYGDSGPYKNYAGHDSNYLALSGLLDLTGSPNSGPTLSGFQLADVGGGTLVALSSILAALYAREKSGKGQKIDVSMMESSLQFLSLYMGIYMSTGKQPERGNELLTGKLPNYSIYEVKDKRYVMLGSLEERFFRVFLRNANLEEKLNGVELKEENFPFIRSVVQEYFQDKTYKDLEPLFTNEDCCLTPIKNFQEVMEDPHLKERGMLFKVQHPKYGEIVQLGSPFRLSENRYEYKSHPPEVGEHNIEIYTKLGFSKQELDSFKKERVI